jgi:hypothetical protein
MKVLKVFRTGVEKQDVLLGRESWKNKESNRQV